MVLADMANPPEHDFAPAWLKIPSEQRSSKPLNLNHSSTSGRLGLADDHQDRFRARHYSTDSQHSYGRSPTHDQPGYRGRDERRHFSNASSRHHSVDDLPWDPDPTTNWNYSQLNGTSSGTYGMGGYPRRGNSVPRSGQQYSNNGRFDGGSLAATRGQFNQGKPPAGSGRQRYNSGPKTGYSDLDDHNDETSSKKEDGQGDGPDDKGKESDKSALSNQDFPSLSGGDIHIKKPSISTKTSVPPGAWEKPPGTTKVISGRKLQLIKKSIPNSSDGKPTQRTMTLSSATIVDPSLGSKVTAQTGATNQSSKGSASSNAGSGVVLKSMISVTPMVSSRAKEPSIRSAPVPVSSSRISPVPSKPSPVPVPIRSVPSNPIPSPAIKVPTPASTRSLPTPIPSPAATPSPKQKAPVAAASKAEIAPDKLAGVNNGKTVSIHNIVSSTETKTTTVTLSKVAASVKPVQQPTNNKPTMVTSMSTVLTSRQTPTLNRLTASSAGTNRPSRIAPVFSRPVPVSTSRHNPVAIINRPITSSSVITSGLTSVSLRSAPVGSMNIRKEKTVVPLQSPKVLPTSKQPPSPISLSTTPTELPNPSPSTPKAKKGDKIGFLTELRRSSNGDVSKEVSQNNEENLKGVGETKRQSRPTSTSKTILQKQHPHSKTNGFNIHSNLTTMEKGTREDTTPNFFPEFSPVRDLPDMSSSLEAEKRLLQEMGWHEHSDNEEGYAPLTEDEKKEFQKRKSQQLKKNGFTTRILPSTWNSASLPISSITQVSLDDTLTSSDSDSSDDDETHS
ncbi:uncharacterized protein [Asterias amurensis]|uniref:uncharacterized protein n=1 Tax=Asterias amurensis TaxID=7602 RepID=UPI003AB4CD7A